MSTVVSLESDKNAPLSLPLSKDEELRDIGHRMSIRNLILGISSVIVSCLIHCDSLLQNAADIIKKCDNYSTKKCNRSLLLNALV